MKACSTPPPLGLQPMEGMRTCLGGGGLEPQGEFDIGPKDHCLQMMNFVCECMFFRCAILRIRFNPTDGPHSVRKQRRMVWLISFVWRHISYCSVLDRKISTRSPEQCLISVESKAISKIKPGNPMEWRVRILVGSNKLIDRAESCR